MSRLGQEPDVISLAESLDLVSVTDPVEAILGLCRDRIDRWVGEAGGIKTIDELEDLMTRNLHMVFEEIRNDRDFDRIKDVYAVGKRDAVFATMRIKFNDSENPTYGVLIQRKNTKPEDIDRWVAVIDCRGKKLARRFFTRWHEIAHRLTTHSDQKYPVYRSEHEPIERLVDEIASHIGFYEPIFGPAFDAGMRRQVRLTFEIVEAIRRGFGDASFQSTLFACHRRLRTPAVYLEASVAHKADDQRDVNQGVGWLFDDLRPVQQLRAVQVVANQAAQDSGLFIAPNMRIPPSSIIHRLFLDGSITESSGLENLGGWEHSGGKYLARRDVWIEARRVKERVIALVQN
jgi:hypothetical protein